MKEVSERPTTGQFVEIWQYRGEIWSSTIRINEDGIEEEYRPGLDDWVESEGGEYLDRMYFIE